MDSKKIIDDSTKLKNILFLLVGSSLLTQILMFAATVLLSRLYSPASFGEYGFYAGFASLFSIVAGLRFDYLSFSSNGSAKFKSEVFYVLTLIVCVILSVLLCFGLFVVDHYFLKNNYSVYLLVFCSVCTAIFYLSSQFLLVKKKYKAFSIWRVIQIVLLMVIGLLFFWKEFDHGLIFAFSFSQLFIGVGVILMYFTVLNKSLVVDAYHCFAKCYKHALINSGICVLQYSTPFAPILIGGFFFAKADLGAYFIFAQIFSAPLSVLRRSFVNFLNAEFGDIQKVSFHWSSKNYEYKKYFLWLLPCLFIVIIFLVFFLKKIVFLLIGEKWIEFSYLIFPVFIYFLMDAFLQPLTTLLPLWGKTRFSFYLEFCRFAYVFIVLPLGVVLFEVNFLMFCIFYFVGMVLFYCINFLKVYVEVKSLNVTYP